MYVFRYNPLDPVELYIYVKHSYEMRSEGLHLKKRNVRTAYVYDHRDICKRVLFI